MGVQILRRCFTVEECYRMGVFGMLTEDDREELIEGEIVEMAPIDSRHQACVDHLTELLSIHMAQRAVVRVPGPIHLSEHSEPQPDLALLRRRADATQHRVDEAQRLAAAARQRAIEIEAVLACYRERCGGPPA
jgi:hypothetical protein